MTKISQSFPVMSMIYALSTAAAVYELLHENWLRSHAHFDLSDFDLSDLTLDDLPS